MNILTQVVVISCVALLIIYDIYVISSTGVEDTISRVILTWSRKYPMIPFIVGVLCGHLFFPQR